MSRREPVLWTVEGALTPERKATVAQALAKLGLTVAEQLIEPRPTVPNVSAERPTATIFSKEQYVNAYRDALGKDNNKWAAKSWNTLKYIFLYDVHIQEPHKDLSFEDSEYWTRPIDPRVGYRPSGLQFYQSRGESTPFDLLDIGSITSFVDNVREAVIEMGKRRGMHAVVGTYGFTERTLDSLYDFANRQTNPSPD